jgi:hypothetical protein
MAATQADASTVDPAKWLATLRGWVPAEPLEDLIALINSLIEASGPARIDGLDALIAHGRNHPHRPQKFKRLRQWSEKMRADPPYWPQRFVRPRAVSILIKAILDKASCPMDRFEVERKFRKFRDVPPSELSQQLKEMAKRGEIDRHAAGLYWRKGTAGKLYETQSQQLYRTGTRCSWSSDVKCRTGSQDGHQQKGFANAGKCLGSPLFGRVMLARARRALIDRLKSVAPR